MEVVAADAIATGEVQAVRGCALGPDARVQVYLPDTKPGCFSVHPLQQLTGMTLLAGVGQGGEVVDIDVPSPPQVLRDTEAGNRHGRTVALRKRAQQAVPVGSLPFIDLLDERSSRGQRRP